MGVKNIECKQMQLPALNLCECTVLAFCDSLNAFSMSLPVNHVCVFFCFCFFLGSVERRGRIFSQHVCCHAQTNHGKFDSSFFLFSYAFLCYSRVCERETERVSVCLKFVQ